MTGKQQRVQQLDSFDPSERRAAIEALARGLPPPSETGNVNMHMHSFFSYNALGHSPSRLAWDARNRGLYAAGLCDFDVLDGLEEFLGAGQLVGLRTTVNLETRAFVADMADADISSPGEPGVTYIMGAGFARVPAPGTDAAEALAQYRRRAKDRNVDLVQRINPHVPEIAIDFEADVVPLTPSGNATERHIVSAYVARAAEVFDTTEALAIFWARTLNAPLHVVDGLLADPPQLEDRVRSRFAKRGGLGYAQPSRDTFPPVDDFIAWVRSCGAIPMITWLDGTSDGERNPAELLGSMRMRGAAALNIIPDRNWNLAEPNERAIKTANLRDVIEIAVNLRIPVNIGTEMNKRGLPAVDDLAADALRPYREIFLDGARIMVGHTLLERYAGFSYIGREAESEYPNAADRNRFFAAVGALPPLTPSRAAELQEMGSSKALDWFRGNVAI